MKAALALLLFSLTLGSVSGQTPTLTAQEITRLLTVVRQLGEDLDEIPLPSLLPLLIQPGQTLTIDQFIQRLTLLAQIGGDLDEIPSATLLTLTNQTGPTATLPCVGENECLPICDELGDSRMGSCPAGLICCNG